MANDLDALYDSPSAESPVSAPAPTSTPAPDTAAELEALRRELYTTKGLLAGLAQQRPALAPEPSPPAEAGWQSKEFLSEGEERLLLESTKPRETLNKMFNSVAQTVHENLTTELRKRDEQIAQLSYGTQQFVQQNQQAQATQHFQQRFYEAHADLKGDDALVAQAAQAVAQEYTHQPWRFGTAEGVLARIGEVARETKKSYLLRWGGGPQGEPAATGASSAVSTPARRAAMETGGSTRVGLSSPPKDSQTKAIGAMVDHVRGGRR